MITISRGPQMPRPTSTLQRPSVKLRLAASLVAMVLAVGTAGCAEGHRPSQAELEAAISQALSTGFTVVSSTATAGSTTWNLKDDDGLRFTCESRVVAYGDMWGFGQWQTVCDYATAWVLANQDRFTTAWARWNPDFTKLDRPTTPRFASLNVHRWADLPELGQALADVLNQNPVPLRTATATWDKGEFVFEPPVLSVFPGSPPNSDFGFGWVWSGWFRTASDPQVDAAQVIEDLKARYASAVSSSLSAVGLWHDSTLILTLQGLRDDYPTSAVPVIAPTGCGTTDTESWPLWATRLGGENTSPSTQTAGRCQESWTINGHVWTLRQLAPTNDSLTPVATKDGKPLPIAPRWWFSARTWAYPMSDIEQLLGGRINPGPDDNTWEWYPAV